MPCKLINACRTSGHKLKTMKKYVFLLIGLIAMFAITSCSSPGEKLVKDICDCYKAQNVLDDDAYDKLSSDIKDGIQDKCKEILKDIKMDEALAVDVLEAIKVSECKDDLQYMKKLKQMCEGNQSINEVQDVVDAMCTCYQDYGIENQADLKELEKDVKKMDAFKECMKKAELMSKALEEGLSDKEKHELEKQAEEAIRNSACKTIFGY